ncbi:hypothetical protein O181_066800 [Austropuccinia psidii MF-1]|uniref:guanosine-diphosphatase n=1 Tax=Austropuccinia psidii MF-1 TaxID=1389203 RepID=A0A9Q3EPM4_9BASI|nr:hypothetical protein [Austropuccinia psidii MF-1]
MSPQAFDSVKLSAQYHLLNRQSSNSNLSSQDQLPLSFSKPSVPVPEQPASPMGLITRFIKYGGWRRNWLLCVVAVGFLLFGFRHRRSFQEFGHRSNLNQEIFSSTNCQPPSGHPAKRFALMIDAGSTGSRIHVYRFSYCLPPNSISSTILPTLDHELFFKTQPGLSSFAGRPSEAAKSLQPLLQAALEGVPADERSCTPISVKATAGLRLLGDKDSKEILMQIERWLRESWPFKLPEKDGVTIMDGADEGVYSWVTINYLLKTIGPSADKTMKNATAAVMDLGGASTQIVFEPQQTKLEPGGHVYKLTFGGRTHALYQHSHLGYGLMEARRAVHQLVAYAELWRKKTSWQSLSTQGPMGNPCLLPGSTRTVTLVNEDRQGPDSKQVVNFFGTGEGFEACQRVVGLMMGKDAICKVSPCAFGGIYQPHFEKAFTQGPIYALSYIYDRLYPLGIKTKFTLNNLLKLVKVICKGTKSNWKLHGLSTEAIEELEGRPESCLDLTFIYSLLSLGYEIDESREILISKKITSIELGWSLGAAIDLLEKTPASDCRKLRS